MVEKPHLGAAPGVPPSPVTAALAAVLLARVERSPRALRDIERGAELLREQFLQEQVTRLRGPRASKDALAAMEEGSVFLEYVAVLARAMMVRE